MLCIILSGSTNISTALIYGKKFSMMGSLDYCSWVTKPAKIPPEMVPVYERYLLGSLATDASLMGHDCVRVLSLKNSSIAKGYLARLEEIGLAPDFVDSSEEVGNYILNMDGMPWEQSPYLVMTRSENTKLLKQIVELNEYREAASSKVANEVEPMIKRRFQEVDALFRHIRNALAHGCFKYLESSDSLFFFYLKQDKSGVSCIGLERIKTFDDWYGLSCSLAELKL